jgi:hypothetical protein
MRRRMFAKYPRAQCAGLSAADFAAKRKENMTTNSHTLRARSTVEKGEKTTPHPKARSGSRWRSGGVGCRGLDQSRLGATG